MPEVNRRELLALTALSAALAGCSALSDQTAEPPASERGQVKGVLYAETEAALRQDHGTPRNGYFGVTREGIYIAAGGEWVRYLRTPAFDSVETNRLTGGLTGGREITTLGGNIYVQPTEPEDPSENDVWIQTE